MATQPTGPGLYSEQTESEESPEVSLRNLASVDQVLRLRRTVHSLSST